MYVNDTATQFSSTFKPLLVNEYQGRLADIFITKIDGSWAREEVSITGGAIIVVAVVVDCVAAKIT